MSQQLLLSMCLSISVITVIDMFLFVLKIFWNLFLIIIYSGTLVHESIESFVTLGYKLNLEFNLPEA